MHKVGVQDLLQDAFESTTKKGTNEAVTALEDKIGWIPKLTILVEEK
jgi:hypothetical protein